MNIQFCDEKLLRIINEFAVKSFENNLQPVSYDLVTQTMLKRVNWKLGSDFSETSNYLKLQERYLVRLDYYYDQIIKKIYREESLDLSKPYFIDFWDCLEKLGFLAKIAKYKFNVIDRSNSFTFLREIKMEIKRENYINRFKTKAIEMIKYKGERRHEIK